MRTVVTSKFNFEKYYRREINVSEFKDNTLTESCVLEYNIALMSKL
jgi:hypothetical protein